MGTIWYKISIAQLNCPSLKTEKQVNCCINLCTDEVIERGLDKQSSVIDHEQSKDNEHLAKGKTG